MLNHHLLLWAEGMLIGKKQEKSFLVYSHSASEVGRIIKVVHLFSSAFSFEDQGDEVHPGMHMHTHIRAHTQEPNVVACKSPEVYLQISVGQVLSDLPSNFSFTGIS